MTIREFQKRIEGQYLERDVARGVQGTFVWFVEEVGELARAIQRKTGKKNLREEFADVLAWLSTLASLTGVDLEAAAAAKYGKGCPACRKSPCRCAPKGRRSAWGKRLTSKV
ncbi:MAG: MazG nucleotide pyrophosphohydrolase domain-containing protein [Planctomycetota bacterium]